MISTRSMIDDRVAGESRREDYVSSITSQQILRLKGIESLIILNIYFLQLHY
jgi:hypothetical protein